MKKQLAKQDKKVDTPDPKKMAKLMATIIECSFLALCFSVIALLVKGISTIFVITLALSIITLLFAIVERRRLNKQQPKE